MQGEFNFCRDVPVRPKRPERLFFGLLLDAETSFRVEQFRQRFVCENRLAGRLLKTECLHVSLHHVGDYPRLPSKFIYAARRAGKAVAMHPFEITFRFVKCFEGFPSSDGRPRRRPIVVLCEGGALSELHKILGAAMAETGLRAAEHLTPHMTLLYSSTPVRLQAIEPIRFAVNEFALIHSALGLTTYNIVDRWPLGN
jgi:2'-5' RNA ligase